MKLFRSSPTDFTQGSIPKHLMSLAVPLIIGNILQQLYNTIDALWTTGDSYKGYAKVQFEKNGYGIEVATDQSRNEYVVWYSNINDLPDGAVVA